MGNSDFTIIRKFSFYDFINNISGYDHINNSVYRDVIDKYKKENQKIWYVVKRLEFEITLVDYYMTLSNGDCSYLFSKQIETEPMITKSDYKRTVIYFVNKKYLNNVVDTD